VSPHGLDSENTSQLLIDVNSAPLRVAFLGRADYVKGIDTLIKAVKAAPELQIELHLYGVTQDGSGYRAILESLAAGDARISFLAPVPHENVIPMLAGYHLLAMPSRTMETGPLVILEAFAAGTAVLGSNLGNIAEWIQHEKNGLLVDFEDVRAWTDALRRCAGDRTLLGTLRAGVRQPRSMVDVALEMARMYRGRVNLESRNTVALGT
jgi:glycosyltransferase involved in cell wall biosynthesis